MIARMTENRGFWTAPSSSICFKLPMVCNLCQIVARATIWHRFAVYNQVYLWGMFLAVIKLTRKKQSCIIISGVGVARKAASFTKRLIGEIATPAMRGSQWQLIINIRRFDVQNAKFFNIWDIESQVVSHQLLVVCHYSRCTSFWKLLNFLWRFG